MFSYNLVQCVVRLSLSQVKKHERFTHGNNRHESFQFKNLKKTNVLKQHIVLHNDDSDDNRGNKRPRRSASPQPGPSGLQSGAGSAKRSRTALNTFQTVKIFPSTTVLEDLELFLIECVKETIKLFE
ncbi:hypothetical protein AVEN_11258-1 [Araneus ventricosus]|uniref:Uncharacterized protein n=1 Tax=Araneus ventricosus TaxID=182803 RepID=A0A4Y2GLH8_ARAVE|nr:hypothetical protein AVEN_11258-1 [Araneus ventricosus]